MSAPTRTILITGGTSGLGYDCALQLARQRPEYLILIASRSDPTSAAATINKLTGQTNVSYLPLDLSSLANVRAFAADYSAKSYPPIQSLVLNAGLQLLGKPKMTVDDIETTFAVNHVGHALLFYLLRPHLADNARIIITASGTHDPAQKIAIPDAIYNSAEELAHPTPEAAKYDGRQRYSTSKLCNILWTYALHRRLTESNSNSNSNSNSKTWTVTAFDPGLMPGTGLARDAPAALFWIWINILPFFIPLLRRFLPNTHTSVESGFALARLAVSDDVEGQSGVYYEGLKMIKSSADSYVVEKQDDLWRWTVNFVAGEKKGEVEEFEKF